MEIALVYREIQQLLIKDENVTLPKVGKFAIVAKPAAFLEDCRTILPPKKDLVFSPSSEQGENAVCEPWQQELAEEIFGQLQMNGVFEVPGFGIFRQSEGGEFSFEVSPEFDFAPDSFSLEAIPLELNPEPAASQPESKPEPEREDKKQNAFIWILVASIILLLIILFVILFKEQFTQMLKNILYTEEELQIIEQWKQIGNR